jgi:hypothetical protein
MTITPPVSSSCGVPLASAPRAAQYDTQTASTIRKAAPGRKTDGRAVLSGAVSRMRLMPSRRLLASLLTLFVPALGICGSLTPLQALASYCADSESSRCAEDENTSDSCSSVPQNVPISRACRSSELRVTLASKEDGPKTKGAPTFGAEAGNESVAALSPTRRIVSLRLAVLAASPPLNLLHETFRN